MPETPITPAPNRTCGECTYCCQYLEVDTEEIQIAPGIPCKHCLISQGCKIHETRPAICRTYFCGWRLSDNFDDTWRPDRLGVLITAIDKNIPAGYPKEGVELLLIQPEIALARPDFIETLYKAVGARLPLYLTLLGPPGHSSAGVFLNKLLEDCVKRDDMQDFTGLLNALVLTLADRPFKKVQLKHEK